MAKKDKNNKSLIDIKSINKRLDFISQGIDNLATTNYSENPGFIKDLSDIDEKIDQSISNIVNTGNDGDSISNISKIFDNKKLASVDGDEFIDGIKKIIGDDVMSNNILSNFVEDKSIIDLDNQIDLLCTYMPVLEDVIGTKVDNILSADHFTKEFINVTSDDTSTDGALFYKIKQLKKKYDLNEKIDGYVYDVCKYGEVYIYNVPYSKAVSRLLNARKKTASGFIESHVIQEAKYKDEKGTDIINTFDIVVEINDTGYIEEFIESAKTINDIFSRPSLSLNDYFNSDSIIESNTNEFENGDRFNNIKIPDNISGDGLISTNNNNSNVNPSDIKVNGAVIRKLERSRITPLYIDTINIGYYYIEVSTNTRENIKNSLLTHSNSVFSSISTTGINNNETAANEILTKLSKAISDKLDSNFINNNANVRDELYLLLKHSYENGYDVDKVKVTYIPPEDIVHIYFKKDEKTNRGVSDLFKSIIPATLYCTLYISDVLGILTRGQDKRVFYVKQTVDTNISANLMNVINQIKKSNFNARSLNNLYNVLNVVGRYNDYFIPMSKSGDVPVQIETMQGQNIDIKQDLYDILERLALSPTDVSKEMIDSRNSLDYAIQQTMANSKFLRKMLKRQSTLMPKLSTFVTNTYNYHYNENVMLEVTLPAPQILNINNINQMINANNEYTAFIIETEMSEQSDEAKAIAKKNLTRHSLGTHIQYDIVDEIIQRSIVEAASKNTATSNSEEG